MQQAIRSDTKAALVAAAERLIAQKGLGTVSVKMITSAAGARNPSAVHYHFGSIESLIEEVFAQRYRQIDDARLARMAQVHESDPQLRLIALLKAAIGPFMETCLEEQGRLYVSFCMQFLNDPRFNNNRLVMDGDAPGLTILRRELVACLSHIPASLLASRLRHGLMIAFVQAADFARRVENSSSPPVDQAVDEAAACLAAYLSAPTQ